MESIMSRFRTTVLFAILGATLATLAPAAAQSRRPMGAVDLLNVPRIIDPQVSPDGRDVLFIQATTDWRIGRRVTHVWKTRVDGTGSPSRVAPAALTDGPARWSPDGNSIAVIARASETDMDQILLFPEEGGEPTPLTKHATGVSNMTWTPDGSAMLFTAADPRTADERAREKTRDDVIAYEETYKQIRLWSVNVATKVETAITTGDYSVGAYDLSTDGRQVVYQRGATPLADRLHLSELWLANIDGSAARQLTANAVPELAPAISPDNSQVLFAATANASLEAYHNGRLFVVSTAGGAPRALAGEREPVDVERALWSDDGKTIYFMANLGVHGELFAVPAAGGLVSQLTDGPHNLVLWSAGPDRLALTIHDSSNDGDVWVFTPSSKALTRVTRVFDFLTRDFELGRQEAIKWRGADGASVEGIVTYPVNYEAGQKYPLVVMIHGGPDISDKYSIGSPTYQLQVLAGRGYAVLQPNHRGSSGYHDAFLRDMIGHYFHNSHLDVIAGVDELVRLGIADPDRLMATGTSAGGHMTNKLISFTGRFKAAASGAGVADWVSMFAQSDIRAPRTPWFGGTPWQKDAPIDVYWNNSPLKTAGDIRTPTLFFVGERDARVGMAQSLMMFNALRDTGVPTRLFIAPREPHSWNELRHLLFRMNAEIEWFEKYVTKRPYTFELAPGDR
jgi:dipeptidyl aminopeptidase/acylaminoacyl peptidase